MSVIVLSGGKSSRMGDKDKPFLPFGENQTIIGFIHEKLRQKFSEIIMVTRTPHRYENLGFCKIVKDIYQAGPLGGLHAGLYYSTSPYSFVMACDMPFINTSLIEYMLKRARKDILIPIIKGEREPLHAVYKKSCLPAIEEEISKDHFKVVSFYHQVQVQELPSSIIQELDPDFSSFFNINTKKDYEKALGLFQKQVDER